MIWDTTKFWSINRCAHYLLVARARPIRKESEMCVLHCICVECAGSLVERRTHNRESQGLNPLCYRSAVWAFPFSPLTPQFTQLYKWVPGYRQWWKCEWTIFARNCCVARMLPGEAELVSERTGLPGGEVWSDLSGPTDSKLRYIKTYLYMNWETQSQCRY